MFRPTGERAEAVALSRECRAQITRRFFQRLQADGSPLVQQPHLHQLLSRQVELLLDDIDEFARAGFRERTGPSAESLRSAADFSKNRAAFDIHPTEAVHAAGLFYELALPVLIRELLPQQPGADDFIHLAQLVNDAVMTQIALGCVGYIQFLREKMHDSHLDERRRLARDLHDRVSHEILAALLGLDLYERDLGSGAEPGLTRLHSAAKALRGALEIIRELSGELRMSVSGKDLEAALRAFRQSAVPVDVASELTVTGDAGQLPTPVAGELYYIIREAVRNAVRHSSPREIRIELEVTRSLVRASVRDDGAGFDAAAVLRQRTSGLTSIRERAELLGGRPRFASSVGGGTTISVSIPLVTWFGDD